MNITEFLKERNITDSDFMETGMTSYIIDLVNEYEAVKSKLILPVVGKSFTVKQIVELLEEEETLDDAKLFFKLQE